MATTIVAVRAVLATPAWTRDIDVLIHSHNVGNPSPCHVYKNSIYQGMIGGSIRSLDEILALELAKHEGTSLKQLDYYVTDIADAQQPEPIE